MVRAMAIVVLLIILGTSPVIAGIDGSTVTLLSPLAPLDSTTLYLFVFNVDNGSYSSEYIRTIRIIFPYGLGSYSSSSMGYEEIVYGRPSFSTSVSVTTCTWSDTYSGGIHMMEDCDIWVQCLTFPNVPQGAFSYINWELEGNWGSTESGSIIVFTPVEAASWGSIKALFM